MKSVITKTNFNFRDIKSKYEGKVRDVYTLSNNNIIVIVIRKRRVLILQTMIILIVAE